MRSATVNMPRAHGPVKDREASRTCQLAAVGSARQQLATLREIGRGLDISLRDLERQRNTADMYAKGLLVAQFTRATCEAFLGMAAGLAQIAFPEAPTRPGQTKSLGVAGQAKVVAAAGKGLMKVAETASEAVLGGSADYAGAAAKVVKSAGGVAETILDAKGVNVKGVELLADGAAVKIEVLHAALNDDAKGTLEKLGKYGYTLHFKVLGLAGLKKTKVVGDTLREAFDYSHEIGSAFEQMLNAQDDNRQQYETSKRNLLALGRRLSAKIAELEACINNAEKLEAR